jgi:xanthine dehydrogenase YagR molybdenum-binding subunit
LHPAASVSHAIATAADAVRKALWRMAEKGPGSRLAGTKLSDVILADGKIVSRRDPNRAMSIAEAMRHGGVERIKEKKSTKSRKDRLYAQHESGESYARNTHSAIFAEVKIDEQLGVIRVTRIVSAVAAGRILRPRPARFWAAWCGASAWRCTRRL